MVEALAEQHMGRVVRAFRCHPWHGRAPLPQPVVGNWLNLKQSQVSKLESGRPRKHLDWLKFVARTLRIPAELLWFKLNRDEPGDTPEAVPTMPPRVPNELLRRARLARVSPSGSGRALSRQELAEAVNATSEPLAPPTDPVTWDAVVEARRELGGLLAGWRERAGLTQLGLGERARWGRSTVANVERGQEARRPFWESCDQATGAQGALLAAADHVRDLADRCRAQETDEGMHQHAAALATHTGADAVESGTADAVGDVPTVHVTVSAGASVTLGFGDGGTVGGQPVRVVVTAADEQPRDLDRPTADGARVYSMAAWRGRR